MREAVTVLLVSGETDYNVIHKKTGASITTIRNALNIGKGSGKIKKTHNVQGYFKTKQPDSTSNQNNDMSKENKDELNLNNVRFEELNDDVKTRLIHQHIQENQGLGKNKPE